MATRTSEVVYNFAANTEKFSKGMGDALNSAVQLTAGLVGMKAGIGILEDLGGAAVNLALEFDESSAKVSTLFGDVAVDTKGLNDQIFELSNTTGIAATELNEGLYSALSAGIPVTEDMGEAMDYMNQATKLSIAGFTSVDKAVDVSTTVLNAYGKEVGEAESVMNTLIETQNAGKTTVDELASSLGKAIPSAADLGIAFEDLSAAMAVLTANGIGTAEATTYLKALFVEMSKPTSDINAIFKDMAGTTIPAYIKQGHTLNEVLTITKKGLDKQKMSWTELSGSQEAWTAASVLTKDGGEALGETFERMTDDTYELNDAVEKMMTPQQSLNRLQQTWNNTLIETGNTIITVLQPAIDWLADNLAWLAPIVVSVTAAFGGLLTVGGAILAGSKLIPIAIAGMSDAFLFLQLQLISVGEAISGMFALMAANPVIPFIAGMAIGLVALSKATAVFSDAANENLKRVIEETENFKNITRDNVEISYDKVSKASDVSTQNQKKNYSELSKEGQQAYKDIADAAVGNINTIEEQQEEYRARQKGADAAAIAKNDKQKLEIQDEYVTKYLESQQKALEAEQAMADVYAQEGVESYEELSEAKQNQYKTEIDNIIATQEQYHTDMLAAEGVYGVQSEEELNAQISNKETEEKKHFLRRLEHVTDFNGSIEELNAAFYIDQQIRSEDFQKMDYKQQQAYLKKMVDEYEAKYGEVNPKVMKQLAKMNYKPFIKNAEDSGKKAADEIADEMGKSKEKTEEHFKLFGLIEIPWIPKRAKGGDDPSSVASGGGGEKSLSRPSSGGNVGVAPQSSSLPYFADGGIVDGGPSGINAIVGEAGPEMILPLNQTGQAFLEKSFANMDNISNSNDVFNITITDPINADEIVQKIDEKFGHEITV